MEPPWPAAEQDRDHAPGLETPLSGPGAKGERLYEWAVASLYPCDHTPPGWRRWLLARRQILTTDQLEQGKRPEIAYYPCAGPPAAGPVATSTDAGSSSRDSDFTSRPIASRSSWSSRPKLCSTFGREVFVAGSHSLWVNCR